MPFFCCNSTQVEPITQFPPSATKRQSVSKVVEYSQTKRTSPGPSPKPQGHLTLTLDDPDTTVETMNVAKVVFEGRDTANMGDDINKKRHLPTPKARHSSRAPIHMKMASSQFAPVSPTHRQQASTDIVPMKHILREGPI